MKTEKRSLATLAIKNIEFKDCEWKKRKSEIINLKKSKKLHLKNFIFVSADNHEQQKKDWESFAERQLRQQNLGQPSSR